jgi:hypothetical protein
VGRPNRPLSQTWRPFLDNHIRSLVSVGFFTVPTVTFVFVVLAHHRNAWSIVTFTDAPRAAWTAQQIGEGVPLRHRIGYLLRDHDGLYGVVFSNRVHSMGTCEVKTGSVAFGRIRTWNASSESAPRGPGPYDRAQ